MRQIICDLDRTILESWDNGYEPRPTPWLEKILAMGKVIAIATNQGGIAWRLAGGRPGKRYPSWPEVEERVLAGMRWTGARFAFVALHHPGASVPARDDPILWERAEEAGIPWQVLWSIQDRSQVSLSYSEGLIVVSWDPDWRKPSPKMLKLALSAAGDPRCPCVYVGDEDSDRLAAEAAGMEFVDVSSLV